MKLRLLLAGMLGLTLTMIVVAEEKEQQPKKVTTESGLTIIHQEAGAGARTGDIVEVLYTGKLDDGTIFDSTARQGGRPLQFVLGRAMVIKGWEEGLLGMQVGEKRTLIIPPHLAYGAEGRGDVIPPNATLTFEVELAGLSRPPQQ